MPFIFLPRVRQQATAWLFHPVLLCVLVTVPPGETQLQAWTTMAWFSCPHISTDYHFYMPRLTWGIPMGLLCMVQDHTEGHALLQGQSKAGEQTSRNSSDTRCSCLGSWITPHICIAYNRCLSPQPYVGRSTEARESTANSSLLWVPQFPHLCSWDGDTLFMKHLGEWDEKDVSRLKKAISLWAVSLSSLGFPPSTLYLSNTAGPLCVQWVCSKALREVNGVSCKGDFVEQDDKEPSYLPCV